MSLETESHIEVGSVWRHKKTGKVVVQSSPGSKFARVKLRHQSGRESMKQQHYFLGEYEAT